MIFTTPGLIGTIFAVVAALAIGVVLAFGVLRLVGEEHKENCIEEAAQTRYPTLLIQDPNSLKQDEIVRNIKQVHKALDDCEATAF